MAALCFLVSLDNAADVDAVSSDDIDAAAIVTTGDDVLRLSSLMS